jgi:glycosyltransferase involved in cell wall biosynthesis
MKVVIVASDPTSGLLQYPVDLGLCFADQGHEVVILSWTLKGQNPDLYDRILASGMTFINEASLEYSFGKQALLRGLMAKPPNLFRPADLLVTFGPLTAWQVRKYLKKSGVSLSMIAAMGHDRTSWWKPLLGAALLNLYTTHVGALCHLEIGRLTKLGVKPRKIVMVHNWIDLERLSHQVQGLTISASKELNAPFGLTPSKKIISCLASFQPRKRQDLLINAFATIASAYPDYDLVLAGEGSERLACERLTSKLGLTERVRFLGKLVNDDAMKLLALSNIVVHCSNAETFGYSMVEPLYLEKATIVTKVGVAYEMANADVAEVVPTDDLDALSKALAKVLLGGEVIEQRKLRARQFVVDNFEVNKIVRQIVGLVSAV